MKVDDNKGSPIIELEDGDGAILISPTGKLEVAFNAPIEQEKLKLNKIQQSLCGICLGLTSSPKFIKLISFLTEKHYEKLNGKSKSIEDPLDSFDIEEVKETNFDELYDFKKMKVDSDKLQ